MAYTPGLTRRAWLRLLAGTAATALATACAAAAPQATQQPAQQAAPARATAPTTPARGGNLTVAFNGEAGELDIQKATTSTTRWYARAFYNSLTNVDQQYNVIPELALSWTAPDPLTWEFKLRTGVTFHDGTPFDAQAVKFNMDRVSDPATASLWRSELYPNVTAVEAPDPTTVRFKMAAPDVTLPPRLAGKAGLIESPTAIQKWGADYGLHATGTGPFELVEWVKDDHLNLKRFDGYWERDAQNAQLPYLDTMVFKPIPDPGVALTALRVGTVDLIQAILPSDLSKLQADQQLTSVEGPGFTQVVWLQAQKPPFNSKPVRQAVALLIDYQAIHDAIYFKTGQVGQYLVSPNNWAFDPSGAFYTRDVAKAKAKLAEAGQSGGVSFTALVMNLPLPLQLAQAVKAQLAEGGVDMTVQPIESAAFTQRRANGDFEAAFSNLSPEADPDSNLTPNVVTGSSVNRGRYSNPQVDALLTQARSIVDQQQRKALYAQVQQLLLDDIPILVLHQDSDIKAMKNTLGGYLPTYESYIGGYSRMWLRK